ncbi:MAG TPA: class II aldolase/adducin family protein [Acidimicrobiales bacterium]|nr:class II aldolase/adducin family protein [Acidimicrobiales bacterium]
MAADLPTDPRAAVARACHVLGDIGQGDMVWGHVSLRDEQGRGVWMKAHAFGFNEIDEDKVLLVSFDGEVLEGEGRRHIEYPIHTEIMRARPDVRCVVHTHSVGAVAFAATGDDLRPISHDACYFVPPALARFTETGDLISTRELGEHLAAAIGDRNALLIPNHGIAVAGASVPHAIMGAVLLDRACRTQLLAGEVRHWSPDDEALAKRASVWSDDGLDLGWNFLTRQAEAHR